MTDRPQFNADAAAQYDRGMPQRVPGYGLALELNAALLRATLPERARILVVGAGTGAEILHLASISPLWRFTALDISPDMLAVAKARCAEQAIAERVDFVAAPMQATQPLPAHNAALAQLVAQFVPHADKDAFYAAIAAALTPRASLLSLDYRPTLGPNAEILHHWALGAGASPDMAKTMLARIAQNWYIPEETALTRHWQQAGFAESHRYMQALGYVGTVLVHEGKGHRV